MFDLFKDAHTYFHRFVSYMFSFFPHINPKVFKFFIMQEQTLPGFYNARDRLGIVDYDTIIADHRSRVLHGGRKAANQDNALPRIQVQGADACEYITAAICAVCNRKYVKNWSH